MAIQLINIGSYANDSTGDDLRTAFAKVNANFAQQVQTAPISSKGKAGDIPGMVAFDSTYYYFCTGNYDGITDIWRRDTLPSGTW